MPVRENTPERAGLRSAILSHVPTYVQSPAKARDFSRAASLCTGETDSSLEGDGFELSVPREIGAMVS